MTKLKSSIIVGSICIIIGAIISAGVTYNIMKPSTIIGSEVISTGDTDKVQIKEVIVYRDRVKIKTVATDKGRIESVISKNILCPELKRKNIIVLEVNPFYQNKSFHLGYNLGYQHIFLNRFILSTGFNINHDLMKNNISGAGLKIGVGLLL